MNLPLEGVVVLDLGQIYNGAYCSFLLARQGATVIKIEPLLGEHLRRRSGQEGAQYPFLMLNSNKQCVTLNLKRERGQALFLKMVKRADVVVENFSVGTMERLGLGHELLQALNPRLIYASGSGFGRSGPYRDYPAMDITIQAISGIMSVTGFDDKPPVKAGPAIADFSGGVHLMAGIVTALFRRERTGQGDLVEVSMHDAVFPTLLSPLGYYFGAGKVPPRTGNRHSGLAEAPYNVYQVADGHMAIFCVNDQHWNSLLKLMGRFDLIDDERYSTIPSRIARIDQVDDLIQDWVRDQTRADLFSRLNQAQVPCAPVNTLDDVVHDPHYHDRGMLVDLNHPAAGPMKGMGSPIRLTGTTDLPITPTAELGEHNDEVYGDWLGLSKEELAALRAEGVI